MKTIAVIGAGLVGRLLAWRFSLDPNVEITLVDQYDRNYFGTGLIAAAMVAPYTEAVSTEAITQHLGARSTTLWSQWLAELETQTGEYVAFDQQGTLVVSHPQDDTDWQRFHIKAKSVLSDDNADQMQLLDQSALSDVEPELATSFSKALYFKNEGVVNNLKLYPVLTQYFDQAENVTWVENTTVKNIDNSGKIEGFDTVFDQVFDCRGNGASADLEQFRSVRGEVARVYAPEVNFTRAVRLMHPRFPLYIAPRKNHEYIIGATQIESDDDSPVTVRSGLELLSALYSLHQGFGEAQIIDLLSGLRPTFMNNLPRVECDNKLIRINGLYRHGYLFAPALLDDLLHHLAGEEDKIQFPQFFFNVDESDNQQDDSNQYQQHTANA
ncbi:MAG TPA: FAD-dependent oxidoreductase [Leucothrix mucor]|nr:FAD-dependent oxidoreductase [Leucothrix mucor]